MKITFLSQELENAEKEVYKKAITLHRYNQSAAALSLGVSRGTLRTKLNKYFPGEFIGTRE